MTQGFEEGTSFDIDFHAGCGPEAVAEKAFELDLGRGGMARARRRFSISQNSPSCAGKRLARPTIRRIRAFAPDLLYA
jgi:hypothetical protein